MFFPSVMWVDGSSCKVFTDPQVLALNEQIMSGDKTMEELQKQRNHDGSVKGVAKFKNGNIAFREDGTFQATIWPGPKKILGKWRIYTE